MDELLGHTKVLVPCMSAVLIAMMKDVQPEHDPLEPDSDSY